MSGGHEYNLDDDIDSVMRTVLAEHPWRRPYAVSSTWRGGEGMSTYRCRHCGGCDE